MGINLPCGNTPLTTTECGGDCDEKIERLAERVSEAEEKLDTIQEGAEVNVNADWEETDPDSDAYIENKPSVNYDLSLGDSAPTVGSAVVGSAVLGSLVDIILGRGDGTEDRVSVSGTGAIQITRDGDTMTIHVPVGEIDQLRNGTDTEARAWAANVLKQWLDERIAQIPADQFLDLNKTVFANPFTWSSTTYPGSINPNLDGKPVLVLALTDGENVRYSFLNMEDLIDAYEGVAPISVNGSQISHDNSGVTAGSYGDSSNQTPNFGDTFKALRSTVDAKGHVTSMSEHTVKIPDTLATQESAGLMSAEDKEKLDNVDQLYKTTCGNPITIDDADGEVKALSVELLPIQDLHGYDKPWAAGAGVNKLIQGETQTFTSNGVTWTANADGSVTARGTAVGNSTFNYINSYMGYTFNGNYKFAFFPSISATIMAAGIYVDKWKSVYPNTITSLDDLHAQISQLWFQVKDGQTADVTFYPMIYSASETAPTSYSPYENICPISPHTSLPVRDTGKNLLDMSNANNGNYNKYNIPNTLKPNTTYTYTVSGSSYGYALLLSKNNTETGQGSTRSLSGYLNNASQTFTTPSDTTEYPYLLLGGGASGAGRADANFQVELGTTATAYAPYTGQTVTVPLNDLYGGTVDVIGGESSETWQNIASYNGETINEPWLSSMDEYVQGTTPTTGAQVCYELATPTDLQTTPTPLTLYKGDNVISSDGDMCITYLQDRGDLTDFINEVRKMHEEVQVTLDADEWTETGTQAVMISGLEPDDSVIVTPAPSDLITYVNAGVVCISQGTDSLTFQANTPVTVNVNILIAR